MTALADFQTFVTDAQAGTQYASWARANPGEVARWAPFRDGLLAGGRKIVPAMTTPHGRELVDAGILYLDATATPPPPPPPPPSGKGSVNGRWLIDASYINTPVGPNPAIDQNNAAYMARVVAMNPNGIWPNDKEWSIPVYPTSSTAPKVSCFLANRNQYVQVPWKPGDLPAPDGSDAHNLLLEEDTGVDYKFQHFVVAANGTVSAWDMELGNVIDGDGVAPTVNRISVTPIDAGLILMRDVAAGVINHGIRCAINCASSGHRWPAVQSDGNDPLGPPSGAKFWLPPTANLGSLSVFQKMLCAALTGWGMPIGDSNGGNAIGIFLEDIVDGSSYPAIAGLPITILEQMLVLAA